MWRQGVTAAAARQAVVSLRAVGALAYGARRSPFTVGDLQRGERIHTLLEGYARGRPPTARGEAEPYTAVQLEAAARHARAEPTVPHLAAASAMLLSVHATARLGDLTRHVRRADCQVDADSIHLFLRKSKTDQRGIGLRRSLPRLRGAQDVGAVIQAWKDLSARWLPSQGTRVTDGTLLFPHLREARQGDGFTTTVVPEKAWDTRSATRYIHRLLKSAGTPASKRQTGHAGRRTGAQELRERGVTTAAIAVAGGWAPTSRVLQHAYLHERAVRTPTAAEADEAVRRAWREPPDDGARRPGEPNA